MEPLPAHIPVNRAQSDLTAVGIINAKGRTARVVVTRDLCGRRVNVPLSNWRDGTRVPRSCVTCARARGGSKMTVMHAPAKSKRHVYWPIIENAHDKKAIALHLAMLGKGATE